MSHEISINEEKFISGEVKVIIFSNAMNHFHVILVEIEETNLPYQDQEIVMTGTFGRILEGESYIFHGELTQHPKYGIQFRVDKYSKVAPSTKEATIKYLSSEQFKGVGEKTAKKIVNHLGLHAVDQILDQPNVLESVPGISKKQIKTIQEILSQEEGMQRAILWLNQLGLSNQLAFKIYQIYAEETLEKIKKNPYRLALDVEGIGFTRADGIAEQLDIAADEPKRIQAALLYTLNELCMSSGDTYIDQNDLCQSTLKILESSRRFIIEFEMIEQELSHLVAASMVIEDDARYFMPSLYASEWGISTEIEHLLKRNEPKYEDSEILDEIKTIERDIGILYGQNQKQAIIQALNAPIFILTGGPGTGKTTVVNGIVKAFLKLNEYDEDLSSYDADNPFPIKLAAPTGRAAKRMNEMTHYPASTIHRLLGLTLEGNEENYLSSEHITGKLLIIDEMSMVDTWLAYQILQAVPRGMQVIFVGDQDQLPSVGPGQVLRDLLKADHIPQIELKEIYRQDEGSSIVSLAHEIKSGHLPNDFVKQHKDRNFFMARPGQVVEIILTIVSKAIQKGYTSEDIQVLAPMYRGEAGIDRLNENLQDIFNPNDGSRKEVQHFENVFRIGDKVLQLVNDPEHNVFNGDIGYIVGISKANENELKTDILTIQFDGNEIDLIRSEWNKITLAYCCSIHKAQGSEYPIVILPLVSSYYRMLQRDLLYTGITRASQSLILIGEPRAYQQAVSSTASVRKTCLAERLKHETISGFEVSFEENNALVEEKEATHAQDFILTAEKISSGAIDPMIGMNGLTPDQL